MRARNRCTTRWLLIAGVAALAALAACIETTPPPFGNQPVIVSFNAEPTEITASGSSTLTWVVTGSGVTLDLRAGTTTLYAGNDLTGGIDVAPTATTTYVLTATNADGAVDAETTVTVTGTSEPPTLTGLTADTVTRSRVALAWSVGGASSVEVYAAASSATDADATLMATLGGSAADHTMPIPNSDRQTVRVCAVTGEARACATTGLDNVVTSGGDYDPYDLQESDLWPQEPVPGTLRYVLENAPVGAIVGFAADVQTVTLFGVDAIRFDTGGWVDSHLIFRRNVTVSAPDDGNGVTITTTSAFFQYDDAPGLPYTYLSRVMHVVPTADVTLERLTVTGGDFIFIGGGIRNDGVLTIRHGTVRGNRSWLEGGGILNNAGASLRLEHTEVVDNASFTTAEEAAMVDGYAIRGSTDPENVTGPLGDSGRGGGIDNREGGVIVLVDSTVDGNRSRFAGGGLYLMEGSTTTFEGTSSVTANEAVEGAGGGIYHAFYDGQQSTSLVPFAAITSIATGNTPTNYVPENVGAPSVSSRSAPSTMPWTIRDR